MSPMLVTLLIHTAVASFQPTLSVSLTLSPPQKLKQLGRGYLEVVKTLFGDIRSTCLKVNTLGNLHGLEHEIHRTVGEKLLDILLLLC